MNHKTGRIEKIMFNVSLKTTQLSLKNDGSDIPKQALFLTEFL